MCGQVYGNSVTLYFVRIPCSLPDDLLGNARWLDELNGTHSAAVQFYVEIPTALNTQYGLLVIGRHRPSGGRPYMSNSVDLERPVLMDVPAKYQIRRSVL